MPVRWSVFRKADVHTGFLNNILFSICGKNESADIVVCLRICYVVTEYLSGVSSAYSAASFSKRATLFSQYSIPKAYLAA